MQRNITKNSIFQEKIMGQAGENSFDFVLFFSLFGPIFEQALCFRVNADIPPTHHNSLSPRPKQRVSFASSPSTARHSAAWSRAIPVPTEQLGFQPCAWTSSPQRCAQRSSRPACRRRAGGATRAGPRRASNSVLLDRCRSCRQLRSTLTSTARRQAQKLFPYSSSAGAHCIYHTLQDAASCVLWL